MVEIREAGVIKFLQLQSVCGSAMIEKNEKTLFCVRKGTEYVEVCIDLR